ncbi:DNA polymerase [Lactiplantibacillus plantarum]|uniref:DNA polymerase n=1 Tax=Lactiplantibacillus plantarum TaxID=1590 RepID=UPI0022E93081|nr:DNA polymerase [Lactiplantibacillus plantarum]
MSENTLSEQELRRLSFLPENQVLPKQNDADWVSYLNSMGMGQALEVQLRASSLIRTLTNKSIHLGFGGWSQDGVRPWIIARQQTLTELQEYLGIGIYSVENNVQIRNYARLKGIDIASLSMSWLVEHRHDDPVIRLLLKKRNQDSLLERYRDRLASLQDHNGIVKLSGTWNPYSSYSGRFTAHDMAMTALPKAMKNYFVAPSRRSSPKIYVSFDANQIELRLLAGASNCKLLIEQFEDGIDLHSYFASKLFETDQSNVSPAMRKLAKTLIYAMLYGAGVSRLDKIVTKSGLLVRSQPISILQSLYPEVNTLLQRFRQGRVLYYGLKPTKFQPRIGTKWLPSSTKQNLPVQSATALLMKQTLVELNNKVNVVNVIHDELICLCNEGDVDETRRCVIAAIMMAANKLDLTLPLKNMLSTQQLGGNYYDNY